MIEKDPVEVLKEVIEEHGTVASLARNTGFSPQYLHDVCAGRSKPSERLLAALGLARIVVKSA